MSYTLSKDNFLKRLNPKIKKEFAFIKNFNDSFFAEDRAGEPRKNKIYGIKTSIDNIKLIPKKLNQIKTQNGIDLIIDDYKFRFIISRKKSVRSGDAKTTKMQELCSLKICENVFKGKVTKQEELVKIYPELPDKIDWQESFQAQEEAFKYIKRVYKFNVTEFNRDKGFMDFITKLVKKLGVYQKDSWNPADIWIHKKDIEKEFDNIKTIFELNNKLLQLFEEKKLCGISLKKTGKTAKVEEVNIKKINKKPNNFIGGKLYLNLKPNNKELLNDELSFDLEHPDGTINAQVRMYPKKAKSNVQISYKLKGGKAEFGKVSAKFRNIIYKEITKSDFPEGKNMPSNLSEYIKNRKNYKRKIDLIIKKKIMKTNIKSFEEFDNNIMKIYENNDINYNLNELITKYQGIEVAYEMSKLKVSDLVDMVTKWSYISQKKGDSFGCFLKIY